MDQAIQWAGRMGYKEAVGEKERRKLPKRISKDINPRSTAQHHDKIQQTRGFEFSHLRTLQKDGETKPVQIDELVAARPPFFHFLKGRIAIRCCRQGWLVPKPIILDGGNRRSIPCDCLTPLNHGERMSDCVLREPGGWAKDLWHTPGSGESLFLFAGESPIRERMHRPVTHSCN